MRIVILLSLCSFFAGFGLISGQSDGSRCQGVSCQGPTPGASCEAKYGNNDHCCPVWHCTQNGYTSTTYGRMTAGGNSQTSYTSSSSSGSGGSYQSSSSSSGFGNLPSFGGFHLQLPSLGNFFGG